MIQRRLEEKRAEKERLKALQQQQQQQQQQQEEEQEKVEREKNEKEEKEKALQEERQQDLDFLNNTSPKGPIGCNLMIVQFSLIGRRDHSSLRRYAAYAALRYFAARRTRRRSRGPESCE
jgi:hypothetical protein